jgi:hypothetical protein
MDRVLFGDNQFFGVNHMSEEKARLQAARFQHVQAIVDVLDAAYEEGIRVFMCTTQDRMVDVCEHFRQHRNRYPGFKFYPCMPYAHKYANAVTEYGLLGALQRFLPHSSKFAALWKGGISLAKRDVEGIAQLLIDSEMTMFRGLETPVVFLQNVLTDLLLGLGYKDAYRIFADHVRRKYNAEPGFITMNLPRLLDVLDESGIKNPIVCSNINKIGFRMCGGTDLYEKTIASRKFRPVAMSVLASGALRPREAIEYIAHQQNIQSIVFGASSRANIAQTKALIDELYSGNQSAPMALCDTGSVQSR